MTTNNPDKTGLQGQINALTRSNEVLRQTYLHLRDANADLMKIIDTFIETRNPDPRQETLPLERKPEHWIEPAAYSMQNNKHIIAHERKLLPFTVMHRDRKCPTCNRELHLGSYAYWSCRVGNPVYCDECIPPLGLGPGDINYKSNASGPPYTVLADKLRDYAIKHTPQRAKELLAEFDGATRLGDIPLDQQPLLEQRLDQLMQDQLAKDAGFTCDIVVQPRLCPGCDSPLKTGDRLYVENMTTCYCRKCFGT